MNYDLLLNYNIFHWKVNDNSRFACIDVCAFIYNDFNRKCDKLYKHLFAHLGGSP